VQKAVADPPAASSGRNFSTADTPTIVVVVPITITGISCGVHISFCLFAIERD
jgi:hypothetical protein